MTKKIKKLTQVILTKENSLRLKNIEQLIKVKSGYARNYLIPKQLGKLATISKIKEFELKRKKLYVQELRTIETAKKNKIILEKIKNFTIRKRINNKKRIFGTIKNKEIIDLIRNESNLELRNLQILPCLIKELGIYNLNISIYPNIIAKIELKLIGK
jgi:large subunit ribosomal protein L9